MQRVISHVVTIDLGLSRCPEESLKSPQTVDGQGAHGSCSDGVCSGKRQWAGGQRPPRGGCRCEDGAGQSLFFSTTLQTAPSAGGDAVAAGVTRAVRHTQTQHLLPLVLRLRAPSQQCKVRKRQSEHGKLFVTVIFFIRVRK